MEKINILYIDDNLTFRKGVKIYLEQKYENFEITIGPNYSFGINEIQNSNFDCIISDYNMPNKNGIEFLKDFRKIDSQTPFILFTNVDENDIKNKALSNGATKFVHKSKDGHNVLGKKILNCLTSSSA